MVLVKTICVMIATGMGLMLFCFISDRAMSASPRSTKMVFKAVLLTLQVFIFYLFVVAILDHPAGDDGCDDKVFCMRTPSGGSGIFRL
jgi:hypothetical protein